jgi:hypothetical protein
MEGEKIQGVTQVAAYVDRIRIHFGSLSRAEAVNLPIPWRRRRLDRVVIDEDTHHGLLGRWCWNLPTDRSHQTRRTHANTKFIAKGACRTLKFPFFYFLIFPRYNLRLQTHAGPHVYIHELTDLKHLNRSEL